jgi:hypothetical protein
MLYGKMAKQFMEEHMKKMGPPQPTEKERAEAEKKNPLPPSPPPPARTAGEARKKGYPSLSTAEYE